MVQNLVRGFSQHFVPAGADSGNCRSHLHVRHDADAMGAGPNGKPKEGFR